MRWAAILRDLGHRVTPMHAYDGRPYDVLVALHARKSASAVRDFRAACPEGTVIVALTGTDLYPDLETAGVDLAVLAAAARLVVLQPAGAAQLPDALRPRTRVITQAVPPIPRQRPRSDCFEVAFLAHLRPVKDPLRLAAAVRLLPTASRIRVTHAGAAYTDELTAEASAESARNPRYDWLGPLPRDEALRVLARSRVLALTSLHEGGANVVSEALAAGVPVVSSHIPGSVGLLGDDYPGYFPVGDAEALARLLDLVERNEEGRYDDLVERCASLGGLVDPARERDAWRGLLADLPTGGA
ncbi:MAG: TIGR04348 family glycosyltransferase [Streptosporangiales bacterium]|nr:TIGR04348 family glycosyltransferase [Streptosporangiales bacterium]